MLDLEVMGVKYKKMKTMLCKIQMRYWKIMLDGVKQDSLCKTFFQQIFYLKMKHLFSPLSALYTAINMLYHLVGLYDNA